MSKRRYFLHLRYKGTNFFGWQNQPEQRTVQGEIESALSKIHANNEVPIVGCGRTDTGVHASNYYAHFDSEIVDDPDQFAYKLNKMLSDEISILEVIPVTDDAHARFDATSRTYHYFIHQEKDPFISGSSLYYSRDLDISKMNKACAILKEYTDFECFSKVKTDVTNFDCDIQGAIWIQSSQGIIFSISANRFLRNMVRAIVGTMIEIGEGKMSLDDFRKVIESKNRSEAGQSVPAHGLFLADISYPYIETQPNQ